MPGAWVTLADVTSPYSITGLEQGTEYEVQVQAVNAVGAWGVERLCDGHDPSRPARSRDPQCRRGYPYGGCHGQHPTATQRLR